MTYSSDRWVGARATLRILAILAILSASYVWRHRRQIFQAALYLACAIYVAAQVTYETGARLRQSLAARIDAGLPMPAHAPEALRQALLRFLARFYGWGLA